MRRGERHKRSRTCGCFEEAHRTSRSWSTATTRPEPGRWLRITSYNVCYTKLLRPFHAVTSDNLKPPLPGSPDPPRAGRFASPDALLTPSYMARAAADPDIRIEPAWKVSLVYGLPCAIYHQLPAAYYLAARFADDFEAAVLHASYNFV